MRAAHLPLIARNILLLVRNRIAKFGRVSQHRARRGVKQVGERAKHTRAQVKQGGEWGRDTLQTMYSSTVRTTRAWERVRRRTWPPVALEWSVRRELRETARGTEPIIVGPWLSEVGYETLYWVPFVRWFADHYHVDSSRLVVVSRGGVSGWYADVASRYVELLDLYPPDVFAERNAQRQAAGAQKQLGLSAFDEDIIDRVKQHLGHRHVRVCHPSTMFRLMRHFWLGTESLQRVIDFTRYTRMDTRPGPSLPGLPDDFVAVKCYTGRALPDSRETRQALRALIGRVARGRPLVLLNTSVTLDEHADFLFEGLDRVETLDRWMTPQNNLAVQTEVIRRATLFVGTCGGLAWLAPLLGTETLALYADEHFLSPHIYAARQVYAQVGAAPFTPVDVHVMAWIGAQAPEPDGVGTSTRAVAPGSSEADV